ncbi:hypothetical protein CI109_100842 [Kwoniella shandongensis]|uniref:Uncharacterized protein n=1 Tax=Kwoniella shandongensis TaxID=1734106 RepID=A0A5M6BU27_9TREE|nr:uncharacterized protein CI109_006095 [Kwoniella shandongensis]KAA5525522.1 hypothetical protein CI109_006095 [Kwoniella shandongensis]
MPSSKPPAQTLHAAKILHTGRVKWYDVIKGEGVIADSDTKQEYIVHESDITMKAPPKLLISGQYVGFQIVKGPKGYEAKSVHAIAKLTATSVLG